MQKCTYLYDLSHLLSLLDSLTDFYDLKYHNLCLWLVHHLFYDPCPYLYPSCLCHDPGRGAVRDASAMETLTGSRSAYSVCARCRVSGSESGVAPLLFAPSACGGKWAEKNRDLPAASAT